MPGLKAYREPARHATWWANSLTLSSFPLAARELDRLRAAWPDPPEWARHTGHIIGHAK
jgi:hypothetical protein